MNDNTTQPRSLTGRLGAHHTEATAPADAGEVSELARLTDPSRTVKKPTESAGQPTGDAVAQRYRVVWVRPSDLASQMTARAAGRGIDFHAELARRSRRLPGRAVQAAVSRRAISERAHRLPPVSAFGRGGASAAGATHSGVGLS